MPPNGQPSPNSVAARNAWCCGQTAPHYFKLLFLSVSELSRDSNHRLTQKVVSYSSQPLHMRRFLSIVSCIGCIASEFAGGNQFQLVTSKLRQSLLSCLQSDKIKQCDVARFADARCCPVPFHQSYLYDLTRYKHNSYRLLGI